MRFVVWKFHRRYCFRSLHWHCWHPFRAEVRTLLLGAARNGSGIGNREEVPSRCDEVGAQCFRLLQVHRCTASAEATINLSGWVWCFSINYVVLTTHLPPAPRQPRPTPATLRTWAFSGQALLHHTTRGPGPDSSCLSPSPARASSLLSYALFRLAIAGDYYCCYCFFSSYFSPRPHSVLHRFKFMKSYVLQCCR